jgi:DNA-directed RNA polymerases I, II, and III subunit RPABC2
MDASSSAAAVAPPPRKETHGGTKSMVSRPVLTKYERAKIVGTRAEQLARGAEAFVPIDARAPFDACEVAMRELAARRLPFILQRHLPDGKTERVHLSDAALLLEPPF